MDTRKDREFMKVRCLQTTGQGNFEEVEYDKPDLNLVEIEVQAVMTGVCRSDIDMMTGSFGPLPLNMQGHEGLGIVTKVGHHVYDVKVGDYVATRGEPAYADYYNVRKNEYVKVPELHPRYILEPVACGVNIIKQARQEINKRCGPNSRLLILGSGFLAWVAHHTLQIDNYEIKIDVVGNSNRDLWGDKLSPNPLGKYDVVVDLGSSDLVFNSDILQTNALIIMGSQKMISTDFSNLLWKACTMIFPSPRNPDFIKYMKKAEEWITSGKLNVDNFWTQAYNRDTEWQQAFADGLARPSGYSRGYIKWL